MSRARIANTYMAVVLVLGFATGSAHAQPAVAEGLISFWTFDDDAIDGDTVLDVVGPNDGLMQGDPNIVPGKIGDGVEFPPASFIHCGTDEGLDLTEALTIELWMMPNSAGEGGANAGPICKAIAGGSWAWQLRYNAPGSFMGFQFNAGASTWVSVQEELAPGEWRHVTGTYDGSDAVCYLDAVEADRVAMQPISTSPDPVLLGQDGWVNTFDGAIDEVRIYDRALTPAEVEQNYASRSQLSVAPAGKVATLWATLRR